MLDTALNDKNVTYKKWADKKASGSLQVAMNKIIANTGAESKYVLESADKKVASSTSLKTLLEDIFKVSDAFNKTDVKNAFREQIEAEIKEEQKEIRLSLEMASDYLHIIIQNRIHNSILINGNLPPTTKNDNKNHGLGIYSVTEAVSQMNGAINFREENNWFIVDVLMQC